MGKMNNMAFTLAALLMGCLSAQAKQQVTVYVCDYYGNEVAKSYETDLATYEDGTFTIGDVLNSGQPLSFRINDEGVGKYGSVEITSPLDPYDTYPYLLSADGRNYLSGKIYDYKGREGETELLWIYVNMKGSTAFHYESTDPEYYVSICLGAFDENSIPMNSWFYLDVYFTPGEFDEPVNDGPMGETVNFSVCHYDEDSEDYVYDMPFASEVVVNDDGSVTVKDFLNSGFPASFTFDDVEIGEYTPVDMCGDVKEWKTNRFYLYAPFGEYLICYSYADDAENTVSTINYPYVYYDAEAESTYVKRESGYEYSVCLKVGGTLSSGGKTPDYYVTGSFNMTSDDSGVSVANGEDTEAPVEYYDLNGVKVANPSAGIYIRKQGNIVKKVVIICQNIPL